MTTEEKGEIKKRYGTELWTEIKKLYESNQQHSYERIKSILMVEFDLTVFPSKRTVERRAKDEEWKRYIEKDIKNFNETYTCEFWECVKAVYESSPKITYKRLREKVQNELQCINFPSPDAINAKAKNEDWQIITKLASKHDADLKNLVKNVKNVTKNMDIVLAPNGKNVIINHDSGESEDGENDEYLINFVALNESKESHKSQIKNLLMSSQFRQKKMAEIIIKNRKRIGVMSDIGDMLSDQLILNHTLLTSPDFQQIDGAVEFVAQENKILRQTIGLYNELTFGRRETMKLELQMYGVGFDDLKATDGESRVKDLTDNTAYEEQKARLIAEREEIARRKQYIESGGLARDTEEEQKRRMDEAGQGEEDEEYDYEGVDD